MYQTCLCFFWGRCVPWRAYLEQYRRVPLVCIIGELLPEGGGTSDERDERSMATQPCANALDGRDEWQCIARWPVRAVHHNPALDQRHARLERHAARLDAIGPAARMTAQARKQRRLNRRQGCDDHVDRHCAQASASAEGGTLGGLMLTGVEMVGGIGGADRGRVERVPASGVS